MTIIGWKSHYSCQPTNAWKLSYGGENQPKEGWILSKSRLIHRLKINLNDVHSVAGSDVLCQCFIFILAKLNYVCPTTPCTGCIWPVLATVDCIVCMKCMALILHYFPSLPWALMLPLFHKPENPQILNVNTGFWGLHERWKLPLLLPWELETSLM